MYCLFVTMQSNAVRPFAEVFVVLQVEQYLKMTRRSRKHKHSRTKIELFFEHFIFPYYFYYFYCFKKKNIQKQVNAMFWRLFPCQLQFLDRKNLRSDHKILKELVYTFGQLRQFFVKR